MKKRKIVRVTKQNIDTIMPKKLEALIIKEAYEMGYRIDVYTGTNNYRLTHKDGRQKWIRGIFFPLNTFSGIVFTKDKYWTNLLLDQEGLPVPNGRRISAAKINAKKYSVAGVKFPVVAKPSFGTAFGKGVITGIPNKKELHQHLARLAKRYNNVLVEEYHTNVEDYRVLVLDGKVIGALHRIRPFVTGDGMHTIQELVEQKNKERAERTEMTYLPIPLDTELKQTIRTQGHTLKSIPKKDEYVLVRNICNLSAGGDIGDVTDTMHSKNKEIAIRAAEVLGLRLAGVDILCKDITVPITKNGGVIIEVNSLPGCALHYYPEYGKPRRVAKEIVKAIFSK